MAVAKAAPMPTMEAPQVRTPETVACIGENAGKLWECLRHNGGEGTNALSRTLGIPQRDVERAIGWLAREGKLEFVQSGKMEAVRLRGDA